LAKTESLGRKCACPKSKFGLFLRNQIFELLAIPWIADLAIGHDLADNIALPDY